MIVIKGKPAPLPGATLAWRKLADDYPGTILQKNLMAVREENCRQIFAEPPFGIYFRKKNIAFGRRGE